MDFFFFGRFPRDRVVGRRGPTSFLAEKKKPKPNRRTMRGSSLGGHRAQIHFNVFNSPCSYHNQEEQWVFCRLGEVKNICDCEKRNTNRGEG